VEKFISDLTNPYFWLGVVLVGIAINMVSSALIKLGGTAIKYVPAWLRSISDARAAEHKAAVVEFLARPELRQMYFAAEMRARMGCLMFLILGLFLFLVAQWVVDRRVGLSPYLPLALLMASTICSLRAMYRLKGANRIHEILFAGFRALIATPPQPSTQVVRPPSIAP